MGFFDFVNSVTDAAQSVVSTVKDGANYVVNPIENFVGITPGKTVDIIFTPVPKFLEPISEPLSKVTLEGAYNMLKEVGQETIQDPGAQFRKLF